MVLVRVHLGERLLKIFVQVIIGIIQQLGGCAAAGAVWSRAGDALQAGYSPTMIAGFLGHGCKCEVNTVPGVRDAGSNLRQCFRFTGNQGAGHIADSIALWLRKTGLSITYSKSKPPNFVHPDAELARLREHLGSVCVGWVQEACLFQVPRCQVKLSFADSLSA